MNSIYYNTYWFNFNGTVNEKLPLTYNTLKICKQKINNIRFSNIKINEINNLGSKLNPINLNISFEEKHINNNIKNIKTDLSSLYSDNKISRSFFKQLVFNINDIIGLILVKPILNTIEFRLKLSTTKLNINHYYLINGKLYVTYKDSFILYKNYNNYINSLNNINNIKVYFLYRNINLNNLNIFNLLDYYLLKIILLVHLLYLKLITNNKFSFRLKQVNWGFYINNKNNLNSLLFGLKYFWLGLKFWIISLSLSIFCVYYLIYIRLLPFNKIIFSWLLIIMFIYWLFSGFVFFIKKYRYGKFTSSIQRFWKRTYIIFWLIEASTFLIFFYLTLNATSEPVYMYDQIKIYKTHLFSWRHFLIKLIPSVIIILLGYYLQLTLKWNLFNKQSSILIIITLLLLYMLWLEFYQFFHILSFFGNINWFFDYDEYIWVLDIDTRRTRLTNNYVAICLFAKFWHFIFIFLFWVFFILRINELNRIRYPLLVANNQNFIIIYIMSWIYMYPWLKFIFRKYLDIPYYWFYLNCRDIGFRVFFIDIKLFLFGLTNRFFNFNIFNLKFERYPFIYWISSSYLTGFDQYRKFVIRDTIIYNLNNYII